LVQLPKEFYVGRNGGQLYGGPVVILVNESTASAAETFSYALQENGRATIIGTQSCGCVLAVLKHREIKGGGELDVSEIAFVSPKGVKLEGTGVTPHQVVRLTLADLQSRRDPVLEAASSFLTSLK
jgi:carboxyl-terminal processing protease